MKGKLNFNVKQLNLSSTLSTGQNFRWQKINSINTNTKWLGIISNLFVVILEQFDAHIAYEIVNINHVLSSYKNNSMNEKMILNDFHKKLEHYFSLDIDLEMLYNHWSKCDHNFHRIVKNDRFKGIRLLRQDLTENIFSFICSSNNNIIRISKMIKKLCENFGTKLYDCSIEKSSSEISEDVYAFPSISSLIACEQKLRDLGFGYRSKFICQTAKKIMNESQSNANEWLKQLSLMTYEDARAQLMSLPGIGAKVADCICLMSLQHSESVPVDTHVYQLTMKLYCDEFSLNINKRSKSSSMTTKKYNEIADFYRQKFQIHAGWAQTILFCSDLKQLSK